MGSSGREVDQVVRSVHPADIRRQSVDLIRYYVINTLKKLGFFEKIINHLKKLDSFTEIRDAVIKLQQIIS